MCYNVGELFPYTVVTSLFASARKGRWFGRRLLFLFCAALRYNELKRAVNRRLVKFARKVYKPFVDSPTVFNHTIENGVPNLFGTPAPVANGVPLKVRVPLVDGSLLSKPPPPPLSGDRGACERGRPPILDKGVVLDIESPPKTHQKNS